MIPDFAYKDIILCILGMAVVSAIPRIVPLSLLAKRKLPTIVMQWLSFVPVSILAALLTPEIFLRDGKFYIAEDNFFLIAAVPTLLVSWLTRSFFGSVAIGMAIVAVLRLVYPLI